MKKLLLSALLLPFIATAQSPAVKKADKLYKSYNYAKVVERLANKKDLGTDARRELADSYRMLGDYSKAEVVYAALIAKPDYLPADVLAYAQILKMNGKYAEAITQMEVYSDLKKNDSRGLLVKENKNYAAELLKDPGNFKIKSLTMNTADQDFGLTYFKGQVVYTSSRHHVTAAQRKWNGNNLDFLDLYIATPDSTGELKESKLMSAINKKYHEGPASYNKEGTKAFYTIDNYKNTSTEGVRNLELYESTFKDGKWGPLKAFILNNNEYSVGHPALSADGKVLYFASDMPGGKGGVDLYRVALGADGIWGQPENLGDQINTEGNETFPFINENGVLFFSSDGHPGLGGLDVFASRLNGNKFSKLKNLGIPVNSSKDDFSFVMNVKESAGYFASSRESGKGSDDLYFYQVLKPLQFGKIIKGVVKDEQGNSLGDVAVTLFNAKGEPLLTVRSLPVDGSFLFEIDETLADFKIGGTKEKFDEAMLNVSMRDQAVVTTELVLPKRKEYGIFLLITDKKTNLPLQDVKVKMTNANGRDTVFNTTASGDYREALQDKRLGDVLSYTIELKKEGYLSKTLEFSKKLENPGFINLHENLDLSMGKMELGSDIGQLINVQPIYFDVGKFNIRPDACKELNKIVSAMIEYPAMVIELGSHTDCRAPKASNMILSDKRAKASAAYVVSKGISADRIYGKGYGESKLKNDCACEGAVKSTCSEDEHQQNRRTEFIIVKLK